MINRRVTLADISFWQDDDYTPYKVDFEKMKSAGIDGVILRAGQNVWLDEDYQDYAKGADLAELPRGAYWFYDSRAHPKVQADLFADQVKLSGFPQLGIWGDYEERYGGLYAGQYNFEIFLNRLKELFPGELIGIYTGPSYWLEHTTYLYRKNFASYPLWIAHYKVSVPSIPAPWTTYKIWQYSETGDGPVYGVESQEMDMNLFNGTLEEYKAFFNIPDYKPGVPPQGEDGMYRVWSESFKMSLRTTNEVTGTKIGEVPVNTIMIADRMEPQLSGGKPGDKWAHVSGVRCTDGIVRSGWVAIIHDAYIYCKVEEIIDPAPEPTPTTHKLEVWLDGVLVFSKDF